MPLNGHLVTPHSDLVPGFVASYFARTSPHGRAFKSGLGKPTNTEEEAKKPIVALVLALAVLISQRDSPRSLQLLAVVFADELQNEKVRITRGLAD